MAESRKGTRAGQTRLPLLPHLLLALRALLSTGQRPEGRRRRSRTKDEEKENEEGRQFLRLTGARDTATHLIGVLFLELCRATRAEAGVAVGSLLLAAAREKAEVSLTFRARLMERKGGTNPFDFALLFFLPESEEPVREGGGEREGRRRSTRGQNALTETRLARSEGRVKTGEEGTGERLTFAAARLCHCVAGGGGRSWRARWGGGEIRWRGVKAVRLWAEDEREMERD